MRRPFSLLVLGVAAAAMMVPASASAGGPRSNVVAAAVQSQDHGTFVAAIKAAGLVETLSGGGPFTVFAPTDAAFAKLPPGTVETLLLPANRDRLRTVLTYHVVPGRVSSAELSDLIRRNGGRAVLKTVQGGTITATFSGGSIVITDAMGGAGMVEKADLLQSNGIIHVTDAVFLPV